MARQPRNKKALTIMFLGTGSDVGKSVITAAFCRIFYQDGYRVAPFKAQNMALNSFITPEGGEMGRAQVVQAEAARIDPHVDMNPVLLKPSSQVGAQVIVRGKVIGNMDAKQYYAYKKELLPIIMESFERLSSRFDIVVMEGAGSAVELNLKSHDLVNMRMAEIANSPVILIGDIDRGGIFASIIGSMVLFTPAERERVKGFLINKFRGEPALFEDGIRIIEEKTARPVLGLIPYFDHLTIPEEDSVALQKRLATHGRSTKNQKFESMASTEVVRIGVVKLPYISNYTDFDALEYEPGVDLIYFDDPDELDTLDCVVIPGSKTTINDLRFLFESNIAKALKAFVNDNKAVIGICGGYQMLGKKVLDPERIESATSEIDGVGVLPVVTKLLTKKVTTQVEARTVVNNWLVSQDETLRGYEIHVGETVAIGTESKSSEPLFRIVTRNGIPTNEMDGCIMPDRTVWGTYLHGIFDNDNLRRALVSHLRHKKGLGEGTGNDFSFAVWKDRQYDLLAEHVRNHVNMEAIYEILGL